MNRICIVCGWGFLPLLIISIYKRKYPFKCDRYVTLLCVATVSIYYHQNLATFPILNGLDAIRVPLYLIIPSYYLLADLFFFFYFEDYFFSYDMILSWSFHAISPDHFHFARFTASTISFLCYVRNYLLSILEYDFFKQIFLLHFQFFWFF